jgi:tRNA(fMet)-specific endonuclease VapC
MGLISVDTTFLIDWSKPRGKAKAAVRDFLAAHDQDRFALCLTVLGEFAAGLENPRNHGLDFVRSKFTTLVSDEEVAMTYRDIFRFLKVRGQLIGANDLWIASHAVRHGVPCVTRNTEEFGRVPGLVVLRY